MILNQRHDFCSFCYLCLIIDTFLKYAGYLSYGKKPLTASSFAFRRLEMYADTGKDKKRELVTLESLGGEIIN